MHVQKFEKTNCVIPSEIVATNRHRFESARAFLDSYNCDGLLEPGEIIGNVLADLMWLCACDEGAGKFEDHLAMASTFFDDERQGRA
ncbi:hypothetical protein P8R33_03845 [Qipengyuania sp. XHP0211]|nr:hypothetical protein [Qipengyuania sp. XHP0211]